MQWEQWIPSGIQLLMTLVIIPVLTDARKTRDELILLRYQVGLLMQRSGIEPPSERPNVTNI